MYFTTRMENIFFSAGRLFDFKANYNQCILMSRLSQDSIIRDRQEFLKDRKMLENDMNKATDRIVEYYRHDK